uniref:RNA helicase n=1 Tax=Arcella intermedia TaxID=1963864 RepID=A0A6B2L0Q1_9EUKA
MLHGGIQEGMEVSVKEERHFSPIKTEIESNLDGMDIEPDPKPEIEEGKETQPRGETDAKEPTPSSTDNGGFLVPKKKVVNRRKRGRNAGLPEGFEFDDSNGDPLEAFMASLSGTVKDLRDQSLKKARKEAEKRGNVTIEEDEPEEATDPNSGLPKRLQRKNLEEVDHSSIDYMPFKKDFYIEVPEIAKLTPEEIKAYRKELDSVKIKGKDCPKPIKAFAQCGLSNKVLYIMNKYEYVKPTPIQAQALPVVMSGRDIIGIAKTGSGKTLAYLLPLFRHIQDQPPLAIGDGPVGLIMAPTRELATQIHYECKKFKKATGIRSVCVYGGAGVQHQIGDLKRGAEIVVCTPGRMIDILCANRGRITNLRRVTMLILDEADRMFDMGFEPQITRIINNIRPDRQTLLFSATFPKSVEAAARRILKNPLEITVRGRGVVADTVEQNVEIIDEEKKKDKLMELISNWYEQGSILVFVDRQESADQLWKDILKSGYQCLVIHGGKVCCLGDLSLNKFRGFVEESLLNLCCRISWIVILPLRILKRERPKFWWQHQLQQEDLMSPISD